VININEDDLSKTGRIVVYGDSNCIDSSHIKNDCFWLLSTFVEYANHNILYSAFKKTNSMALNQHEVVLPRRLDNNGFRNFSRVLNSNAIECGLNDSNYNEIITPIKQISYNNKPSKENNFNFLRLKNVLFSIDDEKFVAHEKDNEIYALSNNLNLANYPSDFPYFTTLAIFFVLAFFFYKVIKQRKRLKKFERFNR
jgi:hypothetical protein